MQGGLIGASAPVTRPVERLPFARRHHYPRAALDAVGNEDRVARRLCVGVRLTPTRCNGGLARGGPCVIDIVARSLD